MPRRKRKTDWVMPCEERCPECNSRQVQLRYMAAGSFVGLNQDALKLPSLCFSDMVLPAKDGLVASRECILFACKRCPHHWVGETLQNLMRIKKL